MTDKKLVEITVPLTVSQPLMEEFTLRDAEREDGVETLTLEADPDEVKRYLMADAERMRQLVDAFIDERMTSESLDTAGDNTDEVATPRVWEFARRLIPDDASLDTYLQDSGGFAGGEKVNFTWREASSFFDYTYASPVPLSMIEEWIAADGFAFEERDANPTQNPNLGEAAPILEWGEAFEAAHPDAEFRATGHLTGPRDRRPHGSAILDGIAIRMQDGGSLDDDVVEWVERRFKAEYDEARDEYVPVDDETLIVSADEFDVRDRGEFEWLRLWWD